MSYQRMLMMAKYATPPVPAFPRLNALFALFVPKWQTERGSVIYDYYGGHDLTAFGSVSWSSTGELLFNSSTRGNYLMSGEFNTTRNDFTILINRRINARAENLSLGMRLVNTLDNEYATESVTMWRDGSRYTCEVGGTDNRQQKVNVVSDGFVYLTNEGYCGNPVTVGNRRNWRRIDVNAYHIYNENYRYPMWDVLRCIAIWKATLTAEEIADAEAYLTLVNTNRDFPL